MKALKKYIKNFSGEIVLVCGLFLVIVIHILLFNGCPIKFFTGVSCAGCGMSRATFALLHLNFKEAFALHPLVLCPPIFIITYILSKFGLPRRVSKVIYTVIIILFIAVYIYRMLDPSDSIVVFEPQKGLIFKAISRLIEALK